MKMKKIVILFVAFAFVTAMGGQAIAESVFATKRMPMSNVASSGSLTGQIPGSVFIFQGGTDPLHGFNLPLWSGSCFCESPAGMGALLGQEDDILVGVGAKGRGYIFVVGFDETLFNCDGADLVLHGLGPGLCVLHPEDVRAPAKVYVSAHNIDDKGNMDYDYNHCFPKPWYYNDANWIYVGTILPSMPPCANGVVVTTPIDFNNARLTDDAVYHPTDGSPEDVYGLGYWEDTGAPHPSPPDKVCWVKVKFGWPTTYNEGEQGVVYFYAMECLLDGGECKGGIYPDPDDLDVEWGDGAAQFVDAIEGLHPSPDGDIDEDGDVDHNDKTILMDNWHRDCCP